MRYLLAIPFLLLAAGCASSGERAPSAESSARHANAPVIFRGDGSPATLADIQAAARVADAVLIGENHGHPLGLATAARIWADLIPSSPNAALALEFFERDEQTHLDDFLAGITDEPGFVKAATLTPSNYPPGHREMILAAKSAHRPVIAANAPRRYVRLARTEGFDRLRALSPEQTRLFRIPDELPTGKYRENFEAFMSPPPSPAPAGHTGTPTPPPAQDPVALAELQKRTEAMFRSQSTWDWTMAESVARSLEAGHRPTLLVIGRFHIDQEGGTLLALKKLRPATTTVTISFVDAWPSLAAPKLADADKARADFVIYVGPGQE